MVYGMKRMVRLAVFLIAVWMGFVTASWAVTFGYAEEAGEENIAAVTVTVEAVDPACGEWAIYLSRALFELAGERDLALLVTVEAAEGYTVEAVELGAGAEGLILTMGKMPARSVSVLLDGRVQRGAEGAILRVKLGVLEEKRPIRGGYMGVTGGKYGEFALYIRDESGKVELIPLVWGGDREESGEVTGNGTEETDETVTEQKETIPAEKWDTEESVKQEPETEEPRPVNDFLGCRETAVREGRFSVQFLFFGVGGDTPVVCIKGGGVLSLEVIRGEDGVSFCTFRGLDGEGSYEFWVYTERGWISVRYEKGRFCGFA
jgi:hypothetical protein